MNGLLKADGTPYNGDNRNSGQRRADGWFNALSGHGVAAFSKSESTQFRVEILDDATASDMWRGDDIAARIVETLPAEAFRQGFKLNMEDKAAAEDVMAVVEEMGVSGSFIEAKEFERAYGGAAIFPVINDGQKDMSQPLNLDRISSISSLLVFEPRELQAVSWYGGLLEPKFGRPDVYDLQAVSEGTAAPPGVRIHESRLIIFRGIRVSRQQTSNRMSWGDSVLNRVVRVLRDYNISWASVAELLSDFAQAVIKIKGLSELIASDRDNIIQARIRAFQLSRSTLRAVLLDSDEEFERKQTPISGMPDLLDRFATRLAAAADMPVTLLMGQSPAGMNATGESDTRFFYDRVAVDQTKKTHSQLERMILLVMLSKDGPLKGKEPDTWSVEFNPLWQPSSKEVAEERKLVADVDTAMIANQVVTPEEVRQARYGGDEYSADLHVELEDVDDLDKELTPEELEAAKATNDNVTGVKPVIEDPAKTAMNGAQIGSLISIVVSVGAKEISRESAKNILITAFPSVSPENADKILGPEEFAPAAAEAPPTPEPSEEDGDKGEGEEGANPEPGEGDKGEEGANPFDPDNKRADDCGPDGKPITGGTTPVVAHKLGFKKAEFNAIVKKEGIPKPKGGTKWSDAQAANIQKIVAKKGYTGTYVYGKGKGVVAANKGLPKMGKGKMVAVKEPALKPTAHEKKHLKSKSAEIKAKSSAPMTEAQFQAQASKDIAKLSKKELLSLEEYTGDGFGNINHGLRNPPPRGSSVGEIRHMTKAIGRTALSNDAVVFRGSNLGGAAPPKIGSVITDKGFMSTTIDPRIAAEFSEGIGTTMKISVPKGTKGIYVDSFSLAEEELEFIMQRGTSIKITGRVKVGSVWELTAEVVEQAAI